MKYCQKCLVECEDGINFCGNCGAPQTDTDAASAAGAEEAEREKDETAAIKAEDVEAAAAEEPGAEEPKAEEKGAAPSHQPHQPYQPETVVFAGGRAPVAEAAAQSKIETHLVKAIVSMVLTVFCCFIPAPFGIMAIIFAVQSDSRHKAKDYSGALEASKKANIWGNLTIAIGVLLFTLWMALVIGNVTRDVANSGLLDLYSR